MEGREARVGREREMVSNKKRCLSPSVKTILPLSGELAMDVIALLDASTVLPILPVRDWAKITLPSDVPAAIALPCP